MGVDMKKTMMAICMATSAMIGVSSFGADRLDASLARTASCASSGPLQPSLAAYRLLLSSKVVVKERRGTLTFYMGASEPNADTKLWNLTPTRIVVVERDGNSKALVGSLYSKTFPMNDREIVASFQGGLNRKIELVPFNKSSLVSIGILSAQVSTEPVFELNHLMMAIIGSGERLVICGSKAELDAFTR